MKLGPFEIKRVNRVAALEKSLAEEVSARAALQSKVQSLEQQSVRTTDLSQLAAQLTGQQGTAPADQIPFGPLLPLSPAGTAREQALGPRRWQYPVGANVQYTPRSGEAVSFEALRNFARLYDVARICIQVRKEELQGLTWKITTKEEGREQEFTKEINDLTRFFEKPDRRNTFDDWLGLLIEDMFVLDALTIHKQYNRGKKLHALRVVDGATIHPVIDEVGDIYGYQQIIHGLPRTAYVDAEYLRAMPDINDVKAVFPLSRLVYRPRVQIPDSLYGFPPLEWVIMTINQALRKQVTDLSWFTEGNTPEGFVTMPDGAMSLEQSKAFEDDFNALLAGNAKARARMKFIPWDAKVQIPRAFTAETAWDEFLLKKTCAAIGVSPQEIGFTADVNKATGEMQENVQFRRSTEPITQFVESMLTEVIETDFGYPALKLTFHAQRAEEDLLAVAQADDIYVKMGATDLDEIRSKRQLGKPYGINRPFIVTNLGPMYLEDALATDFTALDASPSTDEAPAKDVAAEEPAGEEPSDVVRKALMQWRENSLNRVRQGKAPKLEFVSPALSTDIRKAIVAKLEKAHSVEEVRAAFSVFPFPLTKVSGGRDIREPQRRAKLNAERKIRRELNAFWQGQAERILDHLNLSNANE